MIRFFCKIFLISVFFIGLGGIAQTIFEYIFENNEFISSENIKLMELSKIKVIRIEKTDDFPTQKFIYEKSMIELVP